MVSSGDGTLILHKVTGEKEWRWGMGGQYRGLSGGGEFFPALSFILVGAATALALIYPPII